MFAHITSIIRNEDIFNINMYQTLLERKTPTYKMMVHIIDATDFYDLKKCIDSFAIEVINIKRTHQFVFFKNDNIKVAKVI